jgi:ribosomal protein S18 acetylase RimI-like enzyme
MSPPFTLRNATEEDFEFLCTLKEMTMREYAEPIWGWDGSLQRERFRESYVAAGWQIILVAGQLAGGIAVERTQESLFLANIQLLPEYQSCGIGTCLIRQLLEEGRERGVPVMLSVLKTNVPARRLYERLGFYIYEEVDPRLRMRNDHNNHETERSTP